MSLCFTHVLENHYAEKVVSKLIIGHDLKTETRLERIKKQGNYSIHIY